MLMMMIAGGGDDDDDDGVTSAMDMIAGTYSSWPLVWLNERKMKGNNENNLGDS